MKKLRRVIAPGRTVADAGRIRSMDDVFVSRTKYDPGGRRTR